MTATIAPAPTATDQLVGLVGDVYDREADDAQVYELVVGADAVLGIRLDHAVAEDLLHRHRLAVHAEHGYGVYEDVDGAFRWVAAQDHATLLHRECADVIAEHAR